MYRAVLAHLDSAPALWESVPPLASAVSALRERTVEIERLAQIQTETQTTGHTADKAALREALEAQAMDIVRRVRPYARVTGSGALLALVDVSASGLGALPEDELEDRAEAIRAAATEHAEALAPYGVTEARLDMLGAALDAYAPSRATPDAARSRRASATQALPAEFTAALALRDLLDDLVPALVDDADFVATYHQTRRIVD